MLNEVASRSVVRCDGIKFLIDEIKTLAPEMARQGNPVLVVIDQANYLTQGCFIQVRIYVLVLTTVPNLKILHDW